jgi:serine protease Do
MMKARLVCILVLSLTAVAANAHDPFLRRTTAVEVVERVGPSVVNITTERIVRGHNAFGNRTGNPFFDRFFQDFFEPRFPQTSSSLGSGVVIDDKGHILTNQHVIALADRIRVSVGDGREFDAKLIGADPNNDLAVLKAEAAGDLPWIPLSISSDLMLGEPVIAIGNPFGLSNTVTTGVISAIDRSVRTEHRVYHGFLQTDASINPGNSGGSLLNPEGVRVLSIFPGRTASALQERIHEIEGKPYRPEFLLQPEDVAQAVLDVVTLPRSAEFTEVRIRPMRKT